MRIGLDLDKPSQLRLLMSYFNLKHLFGRVHVERSPTGKGYHLLVTGLPPDRELNYVIRCWLKDDPNRIRFDQETVHKPKEILFQVKWVRGKRCEAVPLDERHLLALPFASRIPRGWYRRRNCGW